MKKTEKKSPDKGKVALAQKLVQATNENTMTMIAILKEAGAVAVLSLLDLELPVAKPDICSDPDCSADAHPRGKGKTPLCLVDIVVLKGMSRNSAAEMLEMLNIPLPDGWDKPKAIKQMTKKPEAKKLGKKAPKKPAAKPAAKKSPPAKMAAATKKPTANQVTKPAAPKPTPTFSPDTVLKTGVPGVISGAQIGRFKPLYHKVGGNEFPTAARENAVFLGGFTEASFNKAVQTMRGIGMIETGTERGFLRFVTDKIPTQWWQPIAAD